MFNKQNGQKWSKTVKMEKRKEKKGLFLRVFFYYYFTFFFPFLTIVLNTVTQCDKHFFFNKHGDSV